jgi:hypothetical protein
MTVALVLAAQPDAGLRGELAALGVRRVDSAERAGPGLLTVTALARVAGERVLICVGGDSVPQGVLDRLLDAGGTAAFTPQAAGENRGGALVVAPPDLAALASAAEALAGQRRANGPNGANGAHGAHAANGAQAELRALLGELTGRGVSVRVLDAGPEGDGLVTQLLGDSFAPDLARWAAGRQLAPAALYGISLGFGLLATVWFAQPVVRAQALGVVALLVSFTLGRAAAQLLVTQGTRPAVDWLATVAGLLTEFAVYAALTVSSGLAAQNSAAQNSAAQNSNSAGAVGLNGIFGGSLRDTAIATWDGAGQVGVWRLAVAVMLLLGAKRLAEVCYEGVARASGSIFPRPPRSLFAQVLTLPAGERVAVIAVTALCFGPRLTFVVLLAWGAVAAGYVLAGQLAATRRLADVVKLAGGELPAYRGDGALAHRVGGVVRGQLPPLPPLLVGLLVTCDLAFLGVANLPGVLVLGPVAAMLLAALGARHSHDGRLDWLVPSLLLAGEGVFLVGLGFARQVWLPVILALVAAVITRHLDLAYRARSARPIAYDRFGLGWDGRMLLAGFAALLGLVPFAYAALAAWLWLLAAWDFLGGWLKTA